VVTGNTSYATIGFATALAGLAKNRVGVITTLVRANVHNALVLGVAVAASLKLKQVVEFVLELLHEILLDVVRNCRGDLVGLCCLDCAKAVLVELAGTHGVRLCCSEKKFIE